MQLIVDNGIIKFDRLKTVSSSPDPLSYPIIVLLIIVPSTYSLTFRLTF